jgi:hypothetical protein
MSTEAQRLARESFIETADNFANLMLHIRQWDGINKTDVLGWISNFDTSLRYFAWKLLYRLIYYSERDIELLLREVLFHKTLSREVRETYQIPSGFGRYPSFLNFQLKRMFDKTLIVPVLDSSKPHESGPAVTRIAVQRLGIPDASVLFPGDIQDHHLTSHERIIFIDDNVGSGDQFKDFWTDYPFSNQKQLLSEAVESSQLKVYSLSLVAVKQSLVKLQGMFPKVTFRAAQELSAEYEIFSPESIVWSNDAERLEAQAAINTLLNERGVPTYGHANLSFGVIMHQTIPDWSHPMLWRERPDWKPLLRRKNSNA